MTHRYTPTTVPEEYDALWLESELQRLTGFFQEFGLPRMLYEPLAVAPARPSEGLVVNANGTDWNPGLGAGLYIYLGTRWVPMSGNNFMIEVAKGNVPGHSQKHIFGANTDLGTSLEVVSEGGIYQTPTTVVTLAAISTDVGDTAAGAGAQELTLTYLDVSFAVQTATIAMNGTTETTETLAGVLRLLEVVVSAAGSYGTLAAPSQLGAITIKVAGGGATWATMPLVDTGFGAGHTLVSAYTVPAGFTAYVMNFNMSVDSKEPADLYFFVRESAGDIITPFSGLHVHNTYIGVSGVFEVNHKTFDAFPEKSDLGFLGKAVATADVSAEFELLIVDNTYLP